MAFASRFSSRPAKSALSVSHSHTTSTFHPSLRRARRLTLSRAALPSSFANHQSRRLVGLVQFLHFLCRCQKQPCTRTTVLCFGSTTSGRPGSFFPCSRNLYPILCSSERTTFSGVVSFPRMRLMFQLRRVLVSRSRIQAYSPVAGSISPTATISIGLMRKSQIS